MNMEICVLAKKLKSQLKMIFNLYKSDWTILHCESLQLTN